MNAKGVTNILESVERKWEFCEPRLPLFPRHNGLVHVMSFATCIEGLTTTLTACHYFGSSKIVFIGAGCYS